MWVDCYPSQDTNDSEGGEIMNFPMHTVDFRAYKCHECGVDDPSYDCLMCEWFCSNCEVRLEGEEP
jgi:hypothetical protein